MKLIYVSINKINMRNYLPKDNSSVFEIHFEDNLGKQVIRERMKIEKALASIINSIKNKEELKNYEIGEEVKVVIQDKDKVKRVIDDFLFKAKELIKKLDKKNPENYLDTLSRINRLSVNVSEEIKKLPERKKSFWEERLERKLGK